MKLGIILYSNDPETVWNAFRLANASLTAGDEVRVFLLGKGVECESLSNDKFKILDAMREFLKKQGALLACGTCLKLRNQQSTEMCSLSTMKDLHQLIVECDKVLTF